MGIPLIQSIADWLLKRTKQEKKVKKSTLLVIRKKKVSFIVSHQLFSIPEKVHDCINFKVKVNLGSRCNQVNHKMQFDAIMV